MTPRLPILAAAGLLMIAGAASAATATGGAPVGDVVKGKTLFTQQCALCHSANAGQEGQGPSLYGVIGRKSGSEPGFPAYSRQLRAANLTWAAATLDKFLSGPSTLVPGTLMPIALANPTDRRNVIAYLASLKKGR